MPIPAPPLPGSLLLMRHGEADWPQLERGCALGVPADLIPLTGNGIAEVRNAARAMGDLGLRRVVSSPMTRALQSAHLVAVELGLPFPEVELDLREWQPEVHGDLLTTDQVDRALTAFWAGVTPGSYNGPPFEDITGLRGRVQSVLGRHLGAGPTLVVTHGVVIWGMTGLRLMTASVVAWSAAADG